MNRGDRRVEREEGAASTTAGRVGEHDTGREMVLDCGTVKAEAPYRKRAAARLVMAHFIVADASAI